MVAPSPFHARVDAFMFAYEPALLQAVKDKPQDYPWAYDFNGSTMGTTLEQRVARVAGKMRDAIYNGSYNHDGRGFELACKTLGIPHTRKAIEAYLGRGGDNA